MKSYCIRNIVNQSNEISIHVQDHPQGSEPQDIQERSLVSQVKETCSCRDYI